MNKKEWTLVADDSLPYLMDKQVWERWLQAASAAGHGRTMRVESACTLSPETLRSLVAARPKADPVFLQVAKGVY